MANFEAFLQTFSLNTNPKIVKCGNAMLVVTYICSGKHFLADVRNDKSVKGRLLHKLIFTSGIFIMS